MLPSQLTTIRWRHSDQWHHVTILLLISFLSNGIVHTVTAKHLPDAGGNEVAASASGTHHYQIHLHAQGLHHQHNAATHHLRRLQRDSRAKDAATVQQECDAVKSYFESIDIISSGAYIERGSICGGNCCSNATEMDLLQKATQEFERLLHHHTKSLHGILETTATQFQNHVLELTKQSENKTINVFSTVYSRMIPLSRMLIHQLYSEIIDNLKPIPIYSSDNGQGSKIINHQRTLDETLHTFFVQLFPVAYHQTVHLSKNTYGELHEDYINCLKHNFDDLQPFGLIPKEIQMNLVQSVHMANKFMNALRQSADVLSETDKLYGQHLTDTCKLHLLKKSYCPTCNGQQRGQVKVCYSYCMNVLRGCSAQYAGLLDGPWSGVVDALDNFVSLNIRSDSGIITTIKQLDTKLSAAIMRAMENGPELETKVKKTCGTPNLLSSPIVDRDTRPIQQQHTIKWASPPDAGIVRFLSTIEKSKEFYANIVNNICKDEDISGDDRHCWTGERVGDYTQVLISPGSDTQRYNPEVPLQTNTQLNKLNELVDKLIKIRKSFGSSVSSNTQPHDIQSDMGREGSGGHISDDDEDGAIPSSGDGSGDGSISEIDDPVGTTAISNNIESRASLASGPISLSAIALCLHFTLVIILQSRYS